MGSKKRRSRREAELSKKVYLNQFVILFDYKQNWDVFFGLNRKFCKAVKRNKIKRLFREFYRIKIKPLLNKYGILQFSICLVSKKKCRFENIEDIKIDIEKGLSKVAEKIHSKYK